MLKYSLVLAIVWSIAISNVYGCLSAASFLGGLGSISGNSSSNSSSLEKIITSWVKANGTGYANITNNVRQVSYTSQYVYVSMSSVPQYSIGPWAANPNVPSDQGYTFKFPRTPTINATKTKVGLGHIGSWANGVSIYNPDDGMSYNSLGFWTRNAYFWEGISFDSCFGHAAQNGEYHHHVFPKCLFSQMGGSNTSHAPILGFAFDGIPIYGPYGYNNSNDTSSPIVRIRTSYKIRSITNRTSYANGTALSGVQVGPNINSTYPLGAYLEDFEYSAGHGHLDEYNGRWGKTPEFPNGTYAYFATIDANGVAEYPFVVGINYYGVPQLSGNTGPNSGKNTIPADAITLFKCDSTSCSGAVSFLHTIKLTTLALSVLISLIIFNHIN